LSVEYRVVGKKGGYWESTIQKEPSSIRGQWEVGGRKRGKQNGGGGKRERTENQTNPTEITSRR